MNGLYGYGPFVGQSLDDTISTHLQRVLGRPATPLETADFLQKSALNSYGEAIRQGYFAAGDAGVRQVIDRVRRLIGEWD